MENNEFAEVQVQPVEQNNRLEEALARADKLRTVAFENMTNFIANDKLTTIISAILGCVLLLGLMFGYGWLCSRPELFEEGQMDVLLGFLIGKEWLFNVSMVLFIIGALSYLIITLVMHNKLGIKRVLSEDASASVPRIRNFSRSDVIRTIVSGSFLFLGLVFLCGWLILLFRSAPDASRGEIAEAVAIIIAGATLVTLASVFSTFINTKRFSSRCDELINLLEI